MPRSQRKYPFDVGDVVRFKPSERTQGHYQNLERFGLKPNDVSEIKEIKEEVYLYFEDGKGGWPWNEFELVRKRS